MLNTVNPQPAPVVITKNDNVNVVQAADNKKQTITYTFDTAANTNINDTLNTAKPKFKIVIDDGKGNRKEYNSIDELPAADKSEFLKENPSVAFGSIDLADSIKLASIEKMTMSPEWKKQVLDMKIQGEKMGKQFNSPEWKRQVLAMQLQAAKMGKKFNSAEWKKQMEDMQAQFNSPEWKKQMEDMQQNLQAQFNSPEWKKQMEDMQKQAEKMGKQVNSPEFKKQVHDMKIQAEKMSKEFTNNPEWKQMEDLQKEIKAEVDESLQKAGLDSLKAGN